MKLYKKFAVTGVINSEVEDGGLTSTEAEVKTLESVIISASAIVGNTVKLSLERENIVEIYDYPLNTHVVDAHAYAYPATNKIIEIPVELEIPIGQTAKISILSGATASNIFGAYKYTIK